MADDFNSSDVEYEEPTNPYAGAGLSSIESIIGSAVEDRVSSKIYSKTLIQHLNSPKTEYLTVLFYNRFEAFFVNTLKKTLTPDTKPTGQDIERFFDVLVSKIKPIGNNVPSASWFQVGLKRIFSSLRFKHPKFALTNNEGVRIKSFFYRLLKEGRITREPIRDAQWIGAVLLQRIMIGIFREAWVNGTGNWDKTIQKILSLLLMGALSCRSGDIMKDIRDTHNLPFLCYNDVTIKLVGGIAIQNLQAEVVIRNEKGKKGNATHKRKVLLRAIVGPGRNFACPVKLFIANAKRAGAIQGRAIEEVLTTIASRADKTLQWADGWGRKPVLCAFQTAGHLVLFDTPATTSQALKTIYDASRQVGILKPVITHDLRRGSAQDTANLDRTKLGKGNASRDIASALGHSSRSLEVGITDNYSGRRTDDTWTTRVENKYIDPFGAGVTGNVYQKPNWNRVDLQRMYLAEGIDPNDRKETRKLRDRKYKEHEQLWRGSANQEEGSREALLPKLTNVATSTLGRKRKAEAADADNLKSMLDDEIGGIDSSTIAEIEDDEIESCIDPRLHNQAVSVMDIVSDLEKSDEVADEIQAIVLEQMGDCLELPAALMLPDLEYLDMLCRVNVVANKRFASHKTNGIPDTYRGNGRNEPQLFQYYCKKTPGCIYYSDNADHMKTHEARCSLERVEQIASTDSAFPCDRPGCTSSFSTAVKLQQHITSQHDFKSRHCEKEGCDPTVVYNTRSEWRKHLRDVHPAWKHKRCPVEDCTCKVEFKSAQSLKVHLQVTHRIEDEEMLKTHTWVRTGHFPAQRCTYPTCGHEKEFLEKRHLISHLMKQHGVAKGDVIEWISLE